MNGGKLCEGDRGMNAPDDADNAVVTGDIFDIFNPASRIAPLIKKLKPQSRSTDTASAIDVCQGHFNSAFESLSRRACVSRQVCIQCDIAGLLRDHRPQKDFQNEKQKEKKRGGTRVLVKEIGW